MAGSTSSILTGSGIFAVKAWFWLTGVSAVPPDEAGEATDGAVAGAAAEFTLWLEGTRLEGTGQNGTASAG